MKNVSSESNLDFNYWKCLVIALFGPNWNLTQGKKGQILNFQSPITPLIRCLGEKIIKKEKIVLTWFTSVQILARFGAKNQEL
jgi:hypothetical protein